MTEYIKREDVLELVDKGYLVSNGNPKSVKKFINAIPTADVVERKRGKWEWNIDDGFYYCSECDAVSPREDQNGDYCDCPNFCPCCGADMRGD